CVGVWSLAIAAATFGVRPQLPTIRTTFAVASLIPASLAVTLESLRQSGPLRMSNWTRLLSFIGIAFSVTSFSPYIVMAASRNAGGLKLEYGPLHGLFAAYVVGGFALAAWILYDAHRTSEGEIRLQFRCLSVGLLIPALFATTTNVFIPYIFQTSRV